MKTKLYWTLLSTLHIIKLIVCSLIPEGYVCREFNQLGLLTRDGSTAVDSINLLRCIKNSNVTGNVAVSISVDNDLVITLEGSDAEKSKFISAAATCYRVLGYRLGFSTRYNLTDSVDLTTVGNLRDVLETLYVNSFSRVQRNRITQQSIRQRAGLQKDHHMTGPI